MDVSVRASGPHADWEVETFDIGTLGGGNLTRGAHTGMRALMLAILEEGIRSYFSKAPRIRNEAECWVTNRRHRSPFSFTVVCETLGLEPDAVVTALERMRGEKGPAVRPLRRSRPNVRKTGRLRLRKRR